MTLFVDRCFFKTLCYTTAIYCYIWRVSSQNGLYPFLVNLRYLRFKLLKYKGNNKKICNTFDHNFKNIPYICNEKGIIRKLSFCIIRYCPYFKNCQKWRLTRFAIKTLHTCICFCYVCKWCMRYTVCNKPCQVFTTVLFPSLPR